MRYSPQYGGDVEHFTAEDDDHRDEANEKEHDQFPCIAGSDITHSLYRSTADVTRICAHVTNTAAVAVFLNIQPKS